MDSFVIDVAKIAITVGSVVVLWCFRRSIVKTLTDLVIHADSDIFEDKTLSEILKDVDDRLKEVSK